MDPMSRPQRVVDTSRNEQQSFRVQHSVFFYKKIVGKRGQVLYKDKQFMDGKMGPEKSF